MMDFVATGEPIKNTQRYHVAIKYFRASASALQPINRTMDSGFAASNVASMVGAAGSSPEE